MNSGPMNSQKWGELQMWLEVLSEDELVELIRRADVTCNAKTRERVGFASASQS